MKQEALDDIHVVVKMRINIVIISASSEEIDQLEPWNRSNIIQFDTPKAESLDTTNHCFGKILYARFFLEGDDKANKPIMVIKLDTEKTEHYTDVLELHKQLFQAMIRGIKVKLITESCRSGDHGFGRFWMDSKSL